jgi:hypothetical protein
MADMPGLETRDERRRLEQLRSLLLEEDRLEGEALRREVEALRRELRDPGAVGERTREHFEAQLADLQRRFPEYFGEQLSEALRLQIAESREAVIEALYPIIGKLISRYIQAEIAKVVERLERTVERSFSPRSLRARFFNLFQRRDSAAMLRELHPPVLEDVFLIQKGSGLLLGSYSRQNTRDQDMVAGMLTAIKAFAEDAYRGKSEELLSIRYDALEIFLQSHYRHYFALVISGIATPEYKERLVEVCQDFAATYLDNPRVTADQELQLRLSGLLKEQFHDLPQTDQ